MKRTQFTFYESIRRSTQMMDAPEDRAALYDAVCDFALYGIEPDLSSMSAVVKIAFINVRPNLVASRRKAASGSKGGKGAKQTASKPQANGKRSGSEPQSKAKQTGSEKENEGEKENEKENEIEIEHECDTPARVEPGFSLAFTRFWESYPKKLNRNKAWQEWRKLNPGPDLAAKIAAGLEKWKICPMWNEDGGRYIASACDWLHDRRWEIAPPMGTGKKDVVRGATGELGEAEIQAIRRMMGEDLT